MGDPAEARLDSAQDNGFGPPKVAPDQIGIGDDRPIGATVVDSPGSKIVPLAFLPGCGAVGDEGVDAAAGDAPEKFRFAEAGDIGAGGNVRLGNNTHPVAGGKETLADEGDPDTGTVNIGVSRDQDHVEPLPAAGADFFRSDGQKHGNLVPYLTVPFPGRFGQLFFPGEVPVFIGLRKNRPGPFLLPSRNEDADLSRPSTVIA